MVYSQCEISPGEVAMTRQLRHAAIVAALAAIVLVVGVRAESQVGAHPEPSPIPEAPVVAQVAPPKQPFSARVVKRYGATARVLPSADASVLLNARCGETFPVLAVENGWVKVRIDDSAGWVAGSRVVVSTVPPQVDCAGARAISPNGYVTTSVEEGCSIVRVRPSAEAASLDCVTNGHLYAVLDGPFDPGSGDDWFRVTSPSTGSGWALADHLYPR